MFWFDCFTCIKRFQKNNMNINTDGLGIFYLTMAIVALAFAIVTLPTMLQNSLNKNKKSKLKK